MNSHCRLTSSRESKRSLLVCQTIVMLLYCMSRMTIMCSLCCSLCCCQRCIHHHHRHSHSKLFHSCSCCSTRHSCKSSNTWLMNPRFADTRESQHKTPPPTTFFLFSFFFCCTCHSISMLDLEFCLASFKAGLLIRQSCLTTHCWALTLGSYRYVPANRLYSGMMRLTYP
jgi:hypothetical protein